MYPLIGWRLFLRVDEVEGEDEVKYDISGFYQFICTEWRQKGILKT